MFVNNNLNTQNTYVSKINPLNFCLKRNYKETNDSFEHEKIVKDNTPSFKSANKINQNSSQNKNSTTTQLVEIDTYNKKIRQKKEGVVLDRNPLWDCNIPYQENHYYRMIGEGGYNDFLENGIFRAKQDSKRNYQVAYFEKGRANSIYARHGGAKYILETTQDKIITEEGTYPHTESLTPATDKVRVWKLADIQGKKYEIVLDTINDVLSNKK